MAQFVHYDENFSDVRAANFHLSQIFIYVKFQVLSNFEELQIPGGCKLWELSNFGELEAVQDL
jgi:hypothetical protein